MNKTLAAGCIAASVVVTALVAAGPTAPAASGAESAGRTLKVRPAALERGPDVQLPHLEGRTVVDGDVRFRVAGRHVELLGPSGRAYVVVVRSGGRWSTQRVGPDREPRTLVRGTQPGEVVLSGDGVHVAVVDSATARRTVVEARSARTGRLVGSRAFRGYAEVLDMEESRMVVGGDRVGARWWNVLSDATARITRTHAYEADITGNRLATYTADPYAGGCTRVVRLDRPHRTLWRSCRERVDRFSPEGRRMATVDLLADGLGPQQIWERAARGRLFATYTVAGWFGPLAWELESDFVVLAAGRAKQATVRCSGGVCERASRLRPRPEV